MASDTELHNTAGLKAQVTLGFEEVDRQACLRKRLVYALAMGSKDGGLGMISTK